MNSLFMFGKFTIYSNTSHAFFPCLSISEQLLLWGINMGKKRAATVAFCWLEQDILKTTWQCSKFTVKACRFLWGTPGAQVSIKLGVLNATTGPKQLQYNCYRTAAKAPLERWQPSKSTWNSMAQGLMLQSVWEACLLVLDWFVHHLMGHKSFE